MYKIICCLSTYLQNFHCQSNPLLGRWLPEVYKNVKNNCIFIIKYPKSIYKQLQERDKNGIGENDIDGLMFLNNGIY